MIVNSLTCRHSVAFEKTHDVFLLTCHPHPWALVIAELFSNNKLQRQNVSNPNKDVSFWLALEERHVGVKDVSPWCK